MAATKYIFLEETKGRKCKKIDYSVSFIDPGKTIRLPTN